jgi:ubiquinone/menaquinone biosynthesis C-methylase UbiE
MNSDQFLGEGTAIVTAGAPELECTEERIVPGKVREALFREHEDRYVFAGQFVSGKDVLDVACGVGIGTSYLLRAGARSCTGLDIDRSAIAYARATYPNCAFVESDATSIGLPDSSVDVVVSFETIEHIKDQHKFLFECKRVLRPGGLLVCSTPNRAISRWSKNNPFHVHELTLGEFKQLVKTYFAQVQFYAQKPQVYLLHIARVLAVRAMDRLFLKETVKKIVGWKPPVALESEFAKTRTSSRGEIRPYRSRLFVQPTYVIAVGRNPY